MEKETAVIVGLVGQEATGGGALEHQTVFGPKGFFEGARVLPVAPGDVFQTDFVLDVVELDFEPPTQAVAGLPRDEHHRLSVGDDVGHGRCDYRPVGGYHRGCRGALVQWDPALVEEGLCA